MGRPLSLSPPRLLARRSRSTPAMHAKPLSASTTKTPAQPRHLSINSSDACQTPLCLDRQNTSPTTTPLDQLQRCMPNPSLPRPPKHQPNHDTSRSTPAMHAKPLSASTTKTPAQPRHLSINSSDACQTPLCLFVCFSAVCTRGFSASYGRDLPFLTFVANRPPAPLSFLSLICGTAGCGPPGQRSSDRGASW